MKNYIVLGIIILVAAFLDGIIDPLIVPIVASLICVVIEKKNPILVGLLSSLSVNFLAALMTLAGGGVELNTPDVWPGVIVATIGHAIAGVIIGFIYQAFSKTKKK